MNRSRFLFFLLSLAVLVPVVSGTIAGAVSSGKESDDSLYKYLSIFSEVLSLVRRTYVEETSVDGLFSGALNGATDALDAMATYVPAAAVDGYLEALEIGNRRSGLSLVKDRGIAYVLATAPASPAAVAGLRTGDIVAKIDDTSTRRTPLWRLRGLLAGAPGTELELEILRRGQPRRVTLRLAAYETPPPALERRREVPMVRVANLDARAESELQRVASELAAAGEERLLIDLRGTADGDAAVAYRVAALFASGRLGELRSARELIETFDNPAAPVWSGRLVVLTDRGSQGASEILAAVLQQSAGAELVGEETFGHAGRQRLIELSSGARVHLTDAFYSGPDGVLLTRGLTPAVAVSEASRRFSDSELPLEDLILERGLELLGAEEPQRKAA